MRGTNQSCGTSAEGFLVRSGRDRTCDGREARRRDGPRSGSDKKRNHQKPLRTDPSRLSRTLRFSAPPVIPPTPTTTAGQCSTRDRPPLLLRTGRDGRSRASHADGMGSSSVQRRMLSPGRRGGPLREGCSVQGRGGGRPPPRLRRGGGTCGSRRRGPLRWSDGSSSRRSEGRRTEMAVRGGASGRSGGPLRLLPQAPPPRLRAQGRSAQGRLLGSRGAEWADLHRARGRSAGEEASWGATARLG
jgi:hypothetical protein